MSLPSYLDPPFGAHFTGVSVCLKGGGGRSGEGKEGVRSLALHAGSAIEFSQPQTAADRRTESDLRRQRAERWRCRKGMEEAHSLSLSINVIKGRHAKAALESRPAAIFNLDHRSRGFHPSLNNQLSTEKNNLPHSPADEIA